MIEWKFLNRTKAIEYTFYASLFRVDENVGSNRVWKSIHPKWPILPLSLFDEDLFTFSGGYRLF